MLRSAVRLFGYTISAVDGNIGSSHDFLFDDESWTVRYLVVDTGSWLPGRKVLIRPLALGHPNYVGKLFPVELTRDQVESSPPLETDEPVSRQYEHDLHLHYAWPAYWGADSLGRRSSRPKPKRLEGDSHLRSVREITGYPIVAADGEIGHLEDFILDDEAWRLRYSIIDTKNWLPGRKVLISPAWTKRISFAERRVHVDRSRREIKQSPEFDPSEPINRRYEEKLYDYYGRPHYWTGT